jgi:hypothetical protein
MLDYEPSRFPLTRWRVPALIVGVICLAIAALLGLISPEWRKQAFNSYLFAYLFWLGFALGSMAIVALHNLTGGNWGVLVRRPAEAAAMTLPLMFVLFIPILLGLKYLFPWAVPDQFANEPAIHKILVHQRPWFNPWFFGIRWFIYFAVWIVLTWVLVRRSLRFDETGDRLFARNTRKVSSATIVIYIGLMTLASFDWIMCREAGWYSSIIGFITVVGQTMTAMVFLIALLRMFADRGPLSEHIHPNLLNDLGNLFLTLTILWAYMSFAQLLIIWMGNTRSDTPWYVRRGMGSEPNAWRLVGLFLVIAHFLVPFLLLLQRTVKRRLESLTTLAMVVLVLRLIDVYWMVAPSSLNPTPGLHIHLLDILMPIGIGGVWLWMFAGQLVSRPLVPRAMLDVEDDEGEPGVEPANVTEAGHHGSPGVA